MNSCTYSPQISPGNPFITPPSAVAPTLVQVETVTFTYPYVSPTITVVLPAPELNNRDVIRIERITRETRGKELKTFRYPLWPQIRRLSIAFNGIPLADIATIKSFIKNSIGVEVGYLDYESRQWKGLILNPDTAISQEGRSNCTYTIKFEFEGELV